LWNNEIYKWVFGFGVMGSIKIDVMSWKKYADAVGDGNPIHRFDSAAKKYNLPRKIAPGMYIASFIQGDELISSVKSIKFSGNVFGGDELDISETLKIGRGKDYVFRRGDEVVCEVRGVKFGAPSGAGKPLEDVLYTYETEISQNRINLYLESMNHEGLISVPGMFLASLSAPALLEYGAESGFTGVHASQSFTSHEAYKPGLVKILIGDRRDKGPLSFFEMRAVRDDKIIASMKAGTIPLAA